jgi:large subunit ribosomal protein L35
MPKMKSHSGAKDRFKQTGNGKVVRRRQNHGHNLTKKRPKRKRRLKMPVRLSLEDSLIARKLLGTSINNE